MARRARLRALLLLACCAAARGLVRSVAPAAPPPPLVFFVAGGLGGQGAAPYTTPGQAEGAVAMGAVATASGSHPSFVLTLGDNFFPSGLAGAALRHARHAAPCG
jgi:hypothetical protein